LEIRVFSIAGGREIAEEDLNVLMVLVELFRFRVAMLDGDLSPCSLITVAILRVVVSGNQWTDLVSRIDIRACGRVPC
jgi:hypothetical protein